MARQARGYFSLLAVLALLSACATYPPNEATNRLNPDAGYRDIEGELLGTLFNPVNWFRLASPTFGRIDLAAELYDRTIFENKTFTHLQKMGRPFLMINATDMSMGAPFSFVQSQFDLICSDLAPYPVARAVAASSDFPVAFTPL